MKKLNHHDIAAQAAACEADQNTDRLHHPGSALVLLPVHKKAGANNQRKGQAHLSPGHKLAEAVSLAEAIGLDIRFSGLISLSHPHPATLLGAGNVTEIGTLCRVEGVEVVIIDHSLSPIQQRNLEKAWNAKVLDRTGLILEIFAARAQSKEGRLQVELARLTYQKSRLVRSWTHLERQRGGFGFLGGPGETQIEADRRVIGQRIAAIQDELQVVERTRRLHRKRRKASGQAVVALVGYTNSGKSTLFNKLSGAAVLAKDMLFATLDPTLRRIGLPGGMSFILSDTVGFVSELPTQLVAAFHATLEEVLEADLIIHVRDIASDTTDAQQAEVQKVLSELGLDAAEQEARVIEVWNKSDLLTLVDRQRLDRRAEDTAVLVSAATGEGVDTLRTAIAERLRSPFRMRRVVVNQGNGPLIHWLYENTDVLDRLDTEDGHFHFSVSIPMERERDLDRHLQRS